jgi:hypothetical protein
MLSPPLYHPATASAPTDPPPPGTPPTPSPPPRPSISGCCSRRPPPPPSTSTTPRPRRGGGLRPLPSRLFTCWTTTRTPQSSPTAMSPRRPILSSRVPVHPRRRSSMRPDQLAPTLSSLRPRASLLRARVGLLLGMASHLLGQLRNRLVIKCLKSSVLSPAILQQLHLWNMIFWR